MTSDEVVEPLLLAIDQGWLARIPVEDERSGIIHTDRGSGLRGHDWANAGATMGVWLGVPIAGSVAFVVLDGQPNAWWLVFLWAIGLGVGPLLAWEARHGLLSERTLRVNSDYTELSGRTGWPIKRRRSVRLDQLRRVSCRKRVEQHGFSTYFILRDHNGGHVMLEDTLRTRSAVLRAVTRRPGARVGYVASRQLAGLFTWWVYPLALLAVFPYLGVVFGAATGIAVALGALE